MCKDQQRRAQYAGKQCQGETASDHHDGKRLLRLRSDSVRKRGRQQPENRHNRRHQHRPEAFVRGEARRVHDRATALFPVALKVRHDEDSVLNGDAEDRDEPHRRGDRKVDVCDEQRDYAPGAGHWNGHKDDQGVSPVLDRRVRDDADQENRERHDDEQAALRFIQLVDLASPLRVRVIRQRNRLLDGRLRRLDRAAEVLTADRELDGRVAMPVFAINDRRPLFLFDRRQLCQRNLRAVRRRHGDAANLLEAGAEGFEPAHGKVETFLAFENLRDGLTSDRRLHDRLDVTGIEAVARDLQTVGRDFDARLP